MGAGSTAYRNGERIVAWLLAAGVVLAVAALVGVVPVPNVGAAVGL